VGRSKKNYDHLVDVYGNYGINIAEGIYPGSGLTPGVKGRKGEQGNKGEPGSGDKGQKGISGENGVKGQKGDLGPAGFKGQKGEVAQVFTFKGTVVDLIGLPGDAEMGDIYFVLNEGNAFAWDGADWVQIPNISEITGDKGDLGPQGDKGEPGNNGLDGPGGQDGDKGDKGDKGQDFDPSQYYDADTINQLLENLKAPEFAFDVEYYQDQTSKIENETIDFLSNDAQSELYNPGMVVINPSCTKLNSPVQGARLLVVNYVVDNPGGLRGAGYGMVQHVYNADVGTTQDDAFYRKVRPAQSQFGPWRKLHFDYENYYNKDEANERNTDYRIALLPDFFPNRHQLSLVDRNGNGQESAVSVEGRGGITLTSVQDTLIIDGSPLAGQISLLGTISVNDDVNNKVSSAPQPGEYFIFKDSGVDVNTGETAATGDWLIFGADPAQWRYLDMSVNYGVSEVRVKENKGYLGQTGTIQFPELRLDTEEFNQDYPTKETVGGSTTYNHIANSNDVSVGLNGMTQTLLYDDQRPLDDPLTDDGTYSVNVGNNQIFFSINDSTGTAATGWFGATANDPDAKHRLIDPNGEWQVTGVVSSSGDANQQYTIVYKNGHAALAAANNAQFQIVYFTDYDLEDGDVLIYNEGSSKWIPAQPVTPETLEVYLEMTNPVGAVTQWFGQIVPDGWLRCDGTAFDIGLYPKLHQFLQANYHDYQFGSTPDLRNQFLRSASSPDMSSVTYGKKFSHKTAKPYNFLATSTPNGGHGHTGETADGGDHTHAATVFSGRGSGTGSGQNVLRPEGSGAGNGGKNTTSILNDKHNGHAHDIIADAVGDHAHQINISGWDSETNPKYVECSFIIKTDYNISP
jgi:hypothetical protein